MIALVARQSKDPFFQDGVALVPQSQGKTHRLLAIADAGKAVFVPAIGARTRVVVRQILPSGAAGTVVLAHRAPGTFAEIRAPALPVFLARSGLCQPDLFLRHSGSPFAQSKLSKHVNSSEKEWPVPGSMRSARVGCSDTMSRWESSRISTFENKLPISGAVCKMPWLIPSISPRFQPRGRRDHVLEMPC